MLTSEPYNRSGRPPMFRIAEDVRDRNLNIDQSVIEAIRRHASAIAAILAPHNVAPPPAAPLSPDDEDTPTELEQMDKDDLVQYAEERGIAVDRRWSRTKVFEAIQLHEAVGV